VTTRVFKTTEFGPRKSVVGAMARRLLFFAEEVLHERESIRVLVSAVAYAPDS